MIVCSEQKIIEIEITPKLEGLSPNAMVQPTKIVWELNALNFKEASEFFELEMLADEETDQEDEGPKDLEIG